MLRFCFAQVYGICLVITISYCQNDNHPRVVRNHVVKSHDFIKHEVLLIHGRLLLQNSGNQVIIIRGSNALLFLVHHFHFNSQHIIIIRACRFFQVWPTSNTILTSSLELCDYSIQLIHLITVLCHEKLVTQMSECAIKCLLVEFNVLVHRQFFTSCMSCDSCDLRTQHCSFSLLPMNLVLFFHYICE